MSKKQMALQCQTVSNRCIIEDAAIPTRERTDDIETDLCRSVDCTGGALGMRGRGAHTSPHGHARADRHTSPHGHARADRHASPHGHARADCHASPHGDRSAHGHGRAQVPEQVTGTGAITPLRLDDPLAIASELSESEMTCLAGVAEMGRLMQIFAAPELASTEEQTKFIGCFEDETLLRLFLTGVMGGAGPLSVETSGCIRTGMEGVDLSTVMLSGAAGDEQAAMVGSMSAFILSVMCLNEDEWEGAAATLGLPLEERENLQCVLEELGGPEGFAEVLSAGDEGSFLALFGAAMGCGVQMEGAPGG